MTMAVILIQLVSSSLETPGRTDIARGFAIKCAAGRVIGPGPVHVLADVEVRPAITVKVGSAGARAPEVLAVEARGPGHVHERAPTVGTRHVAEQRHPPIAGDQQIRPTVPVIVTHRDAMAVEKWLIEPGLVGHIAEFELAQVFVEPARMAFDGL
jgi:hypothetical protein